jgi:hypothetical protein
VNTVARKKKEKREIVYESKDINVRRNGTLDVSNTTQNICNLYVF